MTHPYDTCPCVDAEGATTLPAIIASAPKRIYLDIGDALPPIATFNDIVADVTWSADNATGHGIEYVRADLVSPVLRDAKT